MHGYVHGFDRAMAALVKLLPDWFRPIMLFATFAGEPVVLIAMAITIMIAALAKGMHRLVIAELCGLALFGVNTLIKYAVHRTRPETLFVENMRFKSYSFPSGHAFGSMFFYGLLAYLAYTHLPNPWNLWVTIALAVLIFFVGTSRVYLGAHFPSDVVVGWLFAGLCLFVVIKLVKP